MKNIQISIITLTKNNNLKLLKTLVSIRSQIRSFEIEWLIIDGSNKIQYKKNKNLIKKYCHPLLYNKRFFFQTNHQIQKVKVRWLVKLK